MSISALPPNPALHHTSNSISLNHPLPPQIPSPQPALSAAITRILTLTNFNSSLKTRDLQNAFSPWEADRGGFKIKWIDDVTALVVFADPIAAKKAYLSCLLSPPQQLLYPATIRPYDGPDAQAIIHAVNARSHGHRNSFNAAAAAANTGGMGRLGQANGGSISGTAGMNGFAAPQPQSFHVRSGSVGSVNGVDRPSTLATRMGGAGAGVGVNGAAAGGGGVQGHHRALSNSSASGGAGSWGRQSISGVLSGFGGGASGGGNGFGAGFGSGVASNGASLPPLPSRDMVNRLPTHLEGDTPAGTPIKGGGGPGSNNYFPGHAGSQRSSSAASNRSVGIGGHSGSNSGSLNPHDDLSSPPLEIRGGNQYEGGLGVVPNGGGPSHASPSPSFNNVPLPAADGSSSTARRVVPATLPQGARVPRGSAAFGSASGTFGGNSLGAAAGSAFGAMGHGRKESVDAVSAEKALDEVKKALEGLGPR